MAGGATFMTERRALIEAHLALFLMAMAGVLAGHSGFSAWRSTFYRVTLGSLTIGALWLFHHHASWRKALGQWRHGLFAFALGHLLSLHWFAFFESIRLLGVTMGSAMIGIEPIIVALMAATLLKEPLGPKLSTALPLCGGGFLFLFFLALPQGNKNLLLGMAWSLGSFVIFGILVVANRVLMRHLTGTALTSLQMAGAVPLAWWFTMEPYLPQTQAQWAFALGLGLFCTGMAYSWYNRSMKILPATLTGSMLSLEVAYGTFAGWMLGDALTLGETLATLLIANLLLWDLWQVLQRLKTKYLG